MMMYAHTYMMMYTHTYMMTYTHTNPHQVGSGVQKGKVDDPELYRNDEAVLKGEYELVEREDIVFNY